MTEKLLKPAKKNPQLRQKSPLLPPEARSRAGMGLTAAAARGEFALQHCTECKTIQYPPRDVCCSCLSVDLEWRETENKGIVIAETTIHVSPDSYYRENYPWRSGLVQIASNLVILCHLHGDVKHGEPVQMALKLDKAGQGVMIALPMKRSNNMEDDAQLRTLTAHPKHRRVLITDLRASVVVPLVHELQKCGASHIFLGEAEAWRRGVKRDAFKDFDNVSILPLDISDTSSVKKLASEIGGKTDILINTARHIRPGGVLGADTIFAREEMDINALGLMRLAQNFGPAMASRTNDGTNSAVAFVNILSINALSSDPAFGAFSASQAAAYSLSQTLRGEFRASGLRVMNVFTGPTDDEWYQPLPPPKVTHGALAKSIAEALCEGLEDVYCGDIAKDIAQRWRQNAKVLERELTGARDG